MAPVALSAHKRVMKLLLPDGGFRAMAGQEAGVVGQGVDLGTDAVFKGFPIAPGQVGAADRTLEDQVSAEADPLFLAVEHHVAGRVPGGVAHLEGRRAQPEDLAVDEVYGRLGTRVNAKAVQGRVALCAPQDVVRGVQGHQRQGIESVGDGGGPADVVEVGVGVPQVSDPPTAGEGLGQDEVAIPGGVDHSSITAGGVGDQIGVGLGGTEGEGDDFEHGPRVSRGRGGNRLR